jgi:hypothetical protein
MTTPVTLFVYRAGLKMKPLLFLITALLFCSPGAIAKDLRGRVGAGFNQQFGHVSALSVRYAIPTRSPAINVHLEANFGLDTSTTERFDPEQGQMVSGRNVFSGGRLLYGVVAEDNMNLFIGGGVGLLTDGDSNTVRFQPSMGADFFLFGLDNLGFTVEWGLNLDTGGTPGLETAAAVGAGVHYWF